MLELGFLEVRIHPQGVQWHHGHQRRASVDPFAELDASARDGARHRRDDSGAHGGEVGITQIARRGDDIGMIAKRGAVHHRGALRERLLRCGLRRLRVGQRVLRMADFFLRHGTARRELCSARQVGFRLADIVATHVELRLALIDLRELRSHLARGLRQRGLGAFEVHILVGGIERHHDRASLHVVGVVRRDRRHRAPDLRGDQHRVAVDIGIVGAFGARLLQVPSPGRDGEGDADDARE